MSPLFEKHSSEHKGENREMMNLHGKRNRMMRWILPLILLSSCGKNPEELAVIETELGSMIIRFYEDSAPKHVESFKILAGEGYFDGTAFHRVMPEFVIQGGDPNSKDSDRINDGEGGRAGKFYGIGARETSATWMLPAEFNDRPHSRGALSMARGPNSDSAGSQFFICVQPVNRLDGQYTVFGQVVRGLDVVDKIVNVETPGMLDSGYSGADIYNPLEPVRMRVYLTTDEALGIDLADDL